jgi:integrase/recombinase XerC
MDESTLSPLARSFRRHLRAENRATSTIETYLAGMRQAEDFLRARGKELVAADRADLEAFIGDLLSRRAAATAWTYYKVLRILYAWLVEEEEIGASPMARMKPPIVPEQPVPVVPDDGLRRLLKACDGRDFEARRDTAIVMLLLDIGPRRGELAGVKLADVDLDLEVISVLGKGRRPRSLPFGHRAGVALDRYLRARMRHRYRTLTGCGLARRDASQTPGWRRCFAAVARKPASRDCTRTSFATRSPISGSPRAAARPT